MCSDCPVTCVSEANLQKHMEREHSNKDPDDGFVLHEGEFYFHFLFEKKSGKLHRAIFEVFTKYL